MNVLVTGAAGFIGTHIVNRLLERGHSVTAVDIDREKTKEKVWFSKTDFIQCDLHGDFKPVLGAVASHEALIHLAWPGLPNYKDFFHIDQNLVADLKFLKAAVETGVSQLIVAGTCLEYGMQNGPLTEDMETAPTTPYGFAKDTLRKSLELLQKSSPFVLKWMRMFYMYGHGQNPNSLLAHLDRTIDDGQGTFKMSAGDQLRDYLSVQEIATNFVLAMESPDCRGVINCCSGKPISIRELVERRCREKGAELELERGYYPYPDYEPLAFWGVPAKLQKCKSNRANNQK